MLQIFFLGKNGTFKIVFSSSPRPISVSGWYYNGKSLTKSVVLPFCAKFCSPQTAL